MKKSLYTIPLLLLFWLFDLGLMAQSPAQSDINLLRSNLRQLTTLTKSPNWESSSYRSRYLGYLEKAEKALASAQEKDPAADLVEQKSALADYQNAWKTNGAKIEAEKEAERAAMWAEKEKEKEANRQRLAAEEAERQARINATNAEAAQRNAELEARAAEEERQRQAEAERIAQQQQANLQAQPTHPAPAPKGTVEVRLKNGCSNPIKICIDEGGSQTYTRLSANETSYRHLKPGTHICLDNNGQRGTKLGTVSQAGQVIYVCK